jgi:glycosyltransferase involved in cell wall biosynthesis
VSVILFYSPFYRRSRDVESLMLQFKKQGHKVISLSQLPGLDINPFLKSKGIDAYSFVVPGKVSSIYYLRHLVHFVYFCYKQKVDIVFSHLDPANFVASIGQYFIRGTVYLGRHHVDEAVLYKYHLSWTYRLTNFLAKKIIVVSQKSMTYAINEENVTPSKLMHINLAYDFSLYNSPEANNVMNLRKKYGEPALLLLTVCRLTEFKRPELSIKVLQNLLNLGIDARLVILGTGNMQNQLNLFIAENNLSEYVFLEGHVNNVLDYLAASDFLLHPSILESSCVVIKEAGIVKKPVIVCKGVGDFDDYIRYGHNGFLVNNERFVEESVAIIAKHSNDRELLTTIGQNLSKDISALFDIKNVIKKYAVIVRS